MGARPFFKDVRVEIPRGEDGFWTIVRALGSQGPFTIRDIVAQTNCAGGTVSGYCRRLIRGGFIEPVGERPHPRSWFDPSTTYRIAKPVELPPRLTKDGSERPEPQIQLIWRTLKMLRRFTAREIAQEIAPADPEAKINTIRSYLHELARVGIIARIDGGKNKAKHGGGTVEARFRLVRNVGAQAPKILAGKMVFDPNAGALVGPVSAHEVAR